MSLVEVVTIYPLQSPNAHNSKLACVHVHNIYAQLQVHVCVHHYFTLMMIDKPKIYIAG